MSQPSVAKRALVFSRWTACLYLITASAYGDWFSTSWLDEWSKTHLPQGVKVYAVDWLRWEEWRFFDPAPPGGDPDYGYGFNRLRFGIQASREKWAADLSGQTVEQFSLPDDAQGTPGGALGLGATYFNTNQTTDPSSVYVKYLNFSLLDIADTGINLTLGRFDYGSGLETLSGVQRIDWLKDVRLDARLIGGFDWSAYQRSFDGFKLQWDHDSGQLSVVGFRPTQGGFEHNANKHISEVEVLAMAYTFKPGKLVPGAEMQLFSYLFDDTRKVPVRADNTGLRADRQDLHIYNIGGHLAGAYPLGIGVADALLWGVYQGGEWFEQRHDAYGVALELGYQWPDLPWKPWLRAGGFRGSGDEDPKDGIHGTFYQMLPTVRKCAFTTVYNLMNSTDYFVQALLAPLRDLKLRADLHFLSLTESQDLWWQGAGATQAEGTIQGFSGRPSRGATDLGVSMELTANYQVTPVIGLQLFYAHIFGAEVVDNNFPKGDDLDLFFSELSVKF